MYDYDFMRHQQAMYGLGNPLFLGNIFGYNVIFEACLDHEVLERGPGGWAGWTDILRFLYLTFAFGEMDIDVV